jgi:hypothetical protein
MGIPDVEQVCQRPDIEMPVQIYSNNFPGFVQEVEAMIMLRLE